MWSIYVLWFSVEKCTFMSQRFVIAMYSSNCATNVLSILTKIQLIFKLTIFMFGNNMWYYLHVMRWLANIYTLMIHQAVQSYLIFHVLLLKFLLSFFDIIISLIHTLIGQFLGHNITKWVRNGTAHVNSTWLVVSLSLLTTVSYRNSAFELCIRWIQTKRNCNL